VRTKNKILATPLGRSVEISSVWACQKKKTQKEAGGEKNLKGNEVASTKPDIPTTRTRLKEGGEGDEEGTSPQKGGQGENRAPHGITLTQGFLWHKESKSREFDVRSWEKPRRGRGRGVGEGRFGGGGITPPTFFAEENVKKRKGSPLEGSNSEERTDV